MPLAAFWCMEAARTSLTASDFLLMLWLIAVLFALCHSAAVTAVCVLVQ